MTPQTLDLLLLAMLAELQAIRVALERPPKTDPTHGRQFGPSPNNRIKNILDDLGIDG